MKIKSGAKILSVFAFGVILFAIMISGVSAVQTYSFSYINQSYSSSASNLGLYNITYLSSSSISGNLGGQTFGTFSLSSTNTTLNLSLTNIETSNTYYGSSSSVTFNVTGYNSSSTTAPTDVPVNLNYLKSFCDYGDLNASSNQMELSVSVTNDGNSGSGSSTTWDPLDTIKVEVTVYNYNDYDLNNMQLELGLVKKGTNNNIANKLDWISGDNNVASLGTVPSNDNEVYTFEFKVDPKILTNQGSGDYYLMLKAYPQGEENQACIDYSNGFDSPATFGGSNDYASQINIESPNRDNSIVVDSNSLPTYLTASCGQQISLNPVIYNIGDKGNSYSKNQILVAMYSTLNGGTRQNVTLYGDLNSGDSVQSSTPFTFTVPRNADEKSYPVYFTIYYGYDSNSGTYYNNYRWVSNSFSTNVNVQGNCVYATPETTKVQAQLESGGKAGEPLSIQATITNTGTKTVNYNLGLEGYSSWATLSDITPSNITLSPGQSQNVLLNLNVLKSATGGDKQFYLDVYSNGYLITQQPLSLTVTQSFWNKITGNAISGSSALLWGFNILLIVAIVAILLVVILKRRK